MKIFVLIRCAGKHKTSLIENPQEILRMLPSDTMLRTGDVFKPEHYLINTDDGLVYRKEQFHEDDMISAEYLVTDKRAKEILFVMSI